jgi:hypothetical protein
MGTSDSLRKACPPIGFPRSAETVVATRKKGWRLDGHKLDRQRDWLDVPRHTLSHLLRLVPPGVAVDAVDSDVCKGAKAFSR